MVFDRSKHHRRSIRLRRYDYTSTGAYFLTVCSQSRRLLFGEIQAGRMALNDAGRMVERWWRELPRKFPAVRLDAAVVMPNHFHGILVLSNVPAGADLSVRPARLISRAALPSLSGILRWFKTMTTNEYLRRVKADGWPALCGRLWQRNYFEHVVRRAQSLDRIRRYVVENPLKWQFDRENPARPGPSTDEIEDIIREDLHPAEAPDQWS